MNHGESIYDIIPPKMVEQERPPRHKSRFSGTQPPSASTFNRSGTTHPLVGNLAGEHGIKPVKDQHHSGFGLRKGQYSDRTDDYTKKGSKSGGKVLTLAEVKRENPEKLMPEELKPSTRAHGGPPPRSEQPVMNLVSSKNFVVANAVEVILAAPKKLQEAPKDYLKKEDFGKVPKYLQHIKQDIDAEYNYIRELQEQREQAEADRIRPMSEDERQNLLDGLKSKWEQVNTAYQAGTHMTKLDTMGKMKRKEKNEAELSQIEKDIEKLSKRNIVVSSEF